MNSLLLLEKFWHIHHPFSIIDFRIADVVLDITKPKWILAEALGASWMNWLNGKLTDIDFSTTGKILRHILSDESYLGNEITSASTLPIGKRMSLKIALSCLSGSHRSLTSGQGIRLNLRSLRVTLHSFDFWDCQACKANREILILKTSAPSLKSLDTKGQQQKKVSKGKNFLTLTVQLPPSKPRFNNGLDDHIPVVCVKMGTFDLMLDPMFLAWNEYHCPSFTDTQVEQEADPSAPNMKSASAVSSSKKASMKPPGKSDLELPIGATVLLPFLLF